MSWGYCYFIFFQLTEDFAVERDFAEKGFEAVMEA